MLPRAYIKKYGISKEAWAAYRGKKLSKTRKTRTYRMWKRHRQKIYDPVRIAQARRKRGVSMARRHKGSWRGRASRAFKREKALMGGIGYAMIGEPLMDTIAGKIGLGVSDDLLKVGVGYALARKPGVVGDMAKAMLYVNSYKLGKTGFSGIGLGTTNVSGTSTVPVIG